LYAALRCDWAPRDRPSCWKKRLGGLFVAYRRKICGGNAVGPYEKHCPGRARGTPKGPPLGLAHELDAPEVRLGLGRGTSRWDHGSARQIFEASQRERKTTFPPVMIAAEMNTTA